MASLAGFNRVMKNRAMKTAAYAVLMKRTLYDDDHETYRKTLRDFIESRVLPVYDEWYASGIVPREFYRELAVELGRVGAYQLLGE